MPLFRRVFTQSGTSTPQGKKSQSTLPFTQAPALRRDGPWMHDVVCILGPSANGPKHAEFYVQAGDETALPGIARILESLPSNATGNTFIEVLPAQRCRDSALPWRYGPCATAL